MCATEVGAMSETADDSGDREEFGYTFCDGCNEVPFCGIRFTRRGDVVTHVEPWPGYPAGPTLLERVRHPPEALSTQPPQIPDEADQPEGVGRSGFHEDLLGRGLRHHRRPSEAHQQTSTAPIGVLLRGRPQGAPGRGPAAGGHLWIGQLRLRKLHRLPAGGPVGGDVDLRLPHHRQPALARYQSHADLGHESGLLRANPTCVTGLWPTPRSGASSSS